MSTAEKDKTVAHVIRAKPNSSIIGRSDLRHISDVAGDVHNPKDGRRRFIVPGVIPAAPCFLYGPSGCGKTGVAINLALAIGSGRPWGGIEIKLGAVIYVPAEDRYGVEERLIAAADSAGLDPQETNVAVARFDEMGLDGIVEAARQMADRVGLPVTLVIIDTMGAAFGGKSQDDAGPATEMMDRIDRIAQQLRCAVVLIHHTGKSQGSGMRGSQVFFDRARAVIRADRGSLRVEKLSSAPEGASFSFAISSHSLVTANETVSVQIVSDVHPLIQDEQKTREERIDRANQNQADVAFARLLHIATDGNAKMKAWREECDAAWSDKKEGTRQKAFRRAREDLEKSGKITVSADIVKVMSGTCPKIVPLEADHERDNGTWTSPPSLEGVSCPVSLAPQTEGSDDE